jgi:hypothetical protein
VVEALPGQGEAKLIFDLLTLGVQGFEDGGVDVGVRAIDVELDPQRLRRERDAILDAGDAG